MSCTGLGDEFGVGQPQRFHTLSDVLLLGSGVILGPWWAVQRIKRLARRLRRL